MSKRRLSGGGCPSGLTAGPRGRGRAGGVIAKGEQNPHNTPGPIAARSRMRNSASRRARRRFGGTKAPAHQARLARPVALRVGDLGPCGHGDATAAPPNRVGVAVLAISLGGRLHSGGMSHRGSTDEQLLGRLLAPPDLDDGVGSLDYWHRRCRKLSWWRIRARREAVRMTIRWEERVGAAVVSQHWTPLDARASAAVLLARTRLARWIRRAGVAVLALVITVVLFAAVQVAAGLVFLLHVL